MRQNTDILLDVEDLSRDYNGRRAVSNISFQLKKGDILGFLGPNGAGKSTSMQMICGVLAPSAGKILVNDIDLLENSQAAKTFIGYLPEQTPVYRDLTVNEYLGYCAQLHRIPRKLRATAIENAKTRCGLSDCSKRLIGHLSKGFQQRIGIAQAILHTPLLIVLDEPTVGLDPIQIHEIRKLILEIGQEHAVILSTHILPEVQLMCNRVQIIHQGHLIFSGEMENINQHKNSVSLILNFRYPPKHEVLASIQGVKKLAALNDGRIRIYTETGHNPIDALVQTSVEQNWGLIELTPEHESLEHIFVKLTNCDQVLTQEFL